MAYSATTRAPAHGLGKILASVFSGFRAGFGAYVERRSRIGEINRLNALSDAELARLGITRDRIPQHVFRDMFI